MFNKMPNQDFCERRDMSLVNSVNCDLTNTYQSCEPSQKFCRFAYATWCPVCDSESPRRRSKSECIESHCRKRGRDMRSQSPNTRSSPDTTHYLDIQHKLQSSRVLTNLCDLPTSYINCQSNVPSSDDARNTKRFSDFVEPLCTDPAINVKSYSASPPGRVANGFFKQSQSHKLENLDKTPRHIDAKTFMKYNGSTKKNETLPCDRTHLSKSIKEQIIKAVKSHPYDGNNHMYPQSAPAKKESSPVRQNKIANYVSKEPPQNQNHVRRHLPTPRSPMKDTSPHTSSLKEAGDTKKMLPSHIKDIKEKIYAIYNYPEHLNEKEEDYTESKRRVRQRSDQDHSNEIPNEKKIQSCTVIPKKAREISPLEHKGVRSKTTLKIASIKSRHKLSAIKLRKVRSKIAHSVSSDSNHSGSECSETDDEDKSDNYETFDHLFLTNNSDNKSGSTPIGEYAPVTANEVHNKEQWPIRPSLFPYIPPYIAFSSHDSEQFHLPDPAGRYLKWKLSNITPVVVRKTLANTGFRLIRKSNDWSGTWGKHIKSVCFQSLKETQKLNHFPGTFQIGRKDRLWKNLQRMMFKYGQKEFGFIPRTFVLPNDLKLLRQSWEKTPGQDKWIIKPPASARGTGIKVIHRWSHLPKKKSLVVQQYISNPYLINGSKFDLRLYVLVTSFNPLRIYLYPEGLARFASTKYSDDLATLSDRYMHLTNYSINKLSSQYTANEDANACKGHKWTLSKLWEYLEKQGVNTKVLWRNLHQLVIKTMICGESSITQLSKANVNSRYNCYELFGVDVLLDERLKPWLLEVNISPSLHSASPLDLHVKGPLVQSLLNLAQFHLPPKMARFKNTPPCFNSDLYTTRLLNKERVKQMLYCEFENREEYLNDILCELTGDDIRHLAQAEDELTVAGNFERIFPTKHTHQYFQYMETRYYNRLFDAWENRYEKDRRLGVMLLQTLCEKKIHLVVPPPAPVVKPPLVKETSQESTVEETTSDDSVLQNLPIRPQTSPLPVNADPTNKLLRSDVRYKMMNLKLSPCRTATPL